MATVPMVLSYARSKRSLPRLYRVDSGQCFLFFVQSHTSIYSEHLAHGDESGGENDEEMEMPDQVASVAQANSAEFDRLHDSTVVSFIRNIFSQKLFNFKFSHDITAENISKQGYFLLAGAAVVGLAAVFLKNR